VNVTYDICEFAKRLLKAAKRLLKIVAKENNCPPETYDLRSNKGGIAVSGEITLHHEKFYIQIYEGWFGKTAAFTLSEFIAAAKNS
jgi:hypothetical protein